MQLTKDPWILPTYCLPLYVFIHSHTLLIKGHNASCILSADQSWSDSLAGVFLLSLTLPGRVSQLKTLLITCDPSLRLLQSVGLQLTAPTLPCQFSDAPFMKAALGFISLYSLSHEEPIFHHATLAQKPSCAGMKQWFHFLHFCSSSLSSKPKRALPLNIKKKN